LAEAYVRLAEQTEASEQLDTIDGPIVGPLQVKINRTIQ